MSSVPDRPCRPSYYNFVTRADDQSLILYNTKTGAIVLCDRETPDDIIDRACRGDASVEELETLYSQGFIVSEDADELDDIRTWFTKYTHEKRIINLTVLPAEACNFQCPYCYEYVKRNLVMDESTFDALYRMIEKRVQANEKTTYLKLAWFGGEPTLVAERIIRFMNRLKPFVEQSKLDLWATLVTNGYLLTKTLFECFLDSGVTNCQVTLDGDKDNHDLLRPLMGGGPTFDVIYENLKAISTIDRPFRFSVRANFLKSNLDSMRRLLKRFSQDFGHDRRFELYFRPIGNYYPGEGDIDRIADSICSISEGLELQNEMALEIHESLSRESYVRIFEPLPRPAPAWCPSERHHSFIIGADGSVFLCDTYIGVQEPEGRLTPDGDIVLRPEAQVWRKSIFESENNAQCLNCKLLPICLGGCHRVRLAEGGKACYWRESDIIWAMKKYAQLNATRD